MAQRGHRRHHANMYTSLKKPRLGDRVRLTGFLGVFEVVRVRPDGSLVDLKHLDLHQTAYIEQEVSSHDLIYVRGPQPATPPSRTTAAPVASPARVAASGGSAGVQHRSTSPAGYASRTAQHLAASEPVLAGQAQRRKTS